MDFSSPELFHRILWGVLVGAGLVIIVVKVIIFVTVVGRVILYVGAGILFLFQYLKSEEEDYEIEKAERNKIKEWEKMKIIEKKTRTQLEQARGLNS